MFLIFQSVKYTKACGHVGLVGHIEHVGHVGHVEHVRQVGTLGTPLSRLELYALRRINFAKLCVQLCY